MRGSKGFTLIEIIVAVALVAILSAAIAPSVLNNIAQGRISRAQSDVQAIASAVMRFKTDTGKFPRLVDASYPDTGVAGIFDFLASNNGTWPERLAGTADWPKPADFTSNDAPGSVEDFTSHLIYGKSRKSDNSVDSYPKVDALKLDDPNQVGFRGSLMSSDPADPWGNRYMCNVAGLGWRGQAVWVISAGPNGVLETPIEVGGTGALETTGGDDIGFRIQ